MTAFFRKGRAESGRGGLIKTSYTSHLVSIPPDFLSGPPPSTQPPIVYTKIDFAASCIPEYRSHYAVVLDNVLSPAECQELVHLAELSAGAQTDRVAQESEGRQRKQAAQKASDGWQPALVNSGRVRLEYSAPNYRNSDRIIWDSAEVAGRIWSRCLLAPQLRQDLESVCTRSGLSWRVIGLNKRLRFLRYGAGQFFRPHCDGCYESPDQSERTFYTLHLYLNDSVQATKSRAANELAAVQSGVSSSSFPTCAGGATTFHSPDQERRMDIDPVAGRVLIFQHAGLCHSGDDVIEGTKFTVRSDILYKRSEVVKRKTSVLKRSDNMIVNN